jgi:dual oxidase
MDEIVYTLPDSSCPPEYFNIPIPAGDPRYDPEAVGGREMTMLRDRYEDSTGYSPNSPREQVRN